ncbi:ethanolamine ammonia-lyase reactivating factor EutA [Candidatus Saccharibacteria bacterium]|nr:ethanolamine ammonia-lyase reactivating factor EutA [Candidatus Saccharibacteria bacterium]MDQ5885421.1 cell division protein FtsA [Patescibacteria group bacterium]MDQ5953893.1 cell division protein FtsA [Patescibacteria group bacterium]MDQ5958249.1 cell division protein FtsA [Patescibacteria group bacterium]
MLEKFRTKKNKDQPQRQENNDKLMIGLDIGTEYVKALIARVDDNNELEIIGVGKAHQSQTDMQAGAIADIAAVVANCDQALSQAEHQAGVSGRSAVVGIAGELVKGSTLNVRVTRKDPQKEIDVSEIDQIFSLVQERAHEKAKKQLSLETGGKDIALKLVNSALISIEIDGYMVTNPIGFTGKDVHVQLYTAFAPMVHIGAIERVADQLDLDLLTVAAEPFAVARSVIGDDPNADISAILIDVGGGTTDIAVVNEGGVEGTIMFGIGGRSYTKSVERDFSFGYEQAEALKLSLDGGSLSPAKKKQVEQALSKTLMVWMSGVSLALEEFSNLDHLPNRILLCGGGSSLKLIQDELEHADWYKELPFSKKPKIQFIMPSQVSGITDATDLVKDHTLITAMGLLRVGMDTVLQFESDAETIKGRFNRLLKI